ncbi:MAG: ABC transporter permease [Pseudomonadota bacterium]|nr:ABC transporter permease [Pseudomonadota bacterium]
MINELKKLPAYRELIVNFAMREIKAKYKQAALGVTWAVLQPLLQIVIMSLVFSVFARVPSEGIPYPLFLFTCLLPWLFFAGALTRGTTALTNQAGLITKIYFPRESLVIAGLLASLVDFAIAASLYVLMLMYYGVSLSAYALMAIPIFFAQMILVFGLMLLLAPLNAFYRDVSQLMPVMIQFWMYLTPIMYPMKLVPERFQWLYILNPMVGIMDGYRSVMLRHEMPDLGLLAYAYGVGIILLIFGYSQFKRVEMKLADIT